MKKRKSLLVAAPALLFFVVTGAWQMYKPLPEGLDTAAPLRAADEVRFLADHTFLDEQGRRRTDQVIFDQVLALIGQAEKLIVLDMFLLNDFAGEATDTPRLLSEELTRALERRKAEVPGLSVLFITDPFNTLYGGTRNRYLERLRATGVDVVMTDLARLRDPNPAWGVLWRCCFRWLGNSTEGGWLPSPVGGEKVTLRTYLHLLNLKANHRKTLVVDHGDSWAGLVTSGNPHNASSAHSNVALRFHGRAALDLLSTEMAVARLSGFRPDGWVESPDTAGTANADGPRLRVLTEGGVRDAVLETIESARTGDSLSLAMFYLSHRAVITALAEARARGVDVRLLLDPNKDAFGRKKNGIPNRQAALELHHANVPIRWCDTHGEQCHAKLLLHESSDGDATLILGSANLTRRNLDNYNLETDVLLKADADTAVIRDARWFFTRQWHNEPDRHYSVPYALYADPSRIRYGLYRILEATGFSAF